MPRVFNLVSQAAELFRQLDDLSLPERVEALNRLRLCLHQHSPFATEPVDCVQWVAADDIAGNDYNPNTVAPPEMRLLELSVTADGYTQPIVAHRTDTRYVVVDGFHRHSVGRKTGIIRERLHGYLPLVFIRAERDNAADRIAATIRHNRARGVHGVQPMTDIVVSLLKAGWREVDVARELGMDEDEVLRFKQVSGLPELFRNSNYSQSWE